MSKMKLIQNYLVLATLVGMVFIGWQLGNFFHPEPELMYVDPSIQVIPGDEIGTVIFTNPALFFEPLLQCKDDIHYTSYPAKCHTGFSNLSVSIEELSSFIILTPDK